MLFTLLLPFLVAPVVHSAPSKLPYTYWRVGGASDAVLQTPLPGGVVAMGGGPDVDAGFQWLCTRAAGGDLLVVRATAYNDYNAYVSGLCPGFNSVSTLVVPDRATAQLPAVAALVAQAEALFIAGGAQDDYLNFWTDTPMYTALAARVAAGAPVSGTSAGMAVLSDFIYSANCSKGVTSAAALADPYVAKSNMCVTFWHAWLPVQPALPTVVMETHFVTRDRMGRLVAFLARLQTDGWAATPRAIACDENSAVLVDPATNTATVQGSGACYFAQAPVASVPAAVVAPKTPLTFGPVAVTRLRAGDVFSLATWAITSVASGGAAGYAVAALRGVLSSSQLGGSAY